MSKASIHIKPVKPNSEVHNFRKKKYDYVREDLTPTNETWKSRSISETRKEAEEKYKISVGRRMQKKAEPIREGVVVLEPHHTMKDLHKLKDKLFQTFGIKTIQMFIHRDEGHWNDEIWMPNLHAHLVFDWTHDTGKSIRLNRFDMSKIQDIVSEVLNMERGQKSDKKHLSAIAYKVEQQKKNLQEIESVLKSDIKPKTILGVRVDVEKRDEALKLAQIKNKKLEDIVKKQNDYIVSVAMLAEKAAKYDSLYAEHEKLKQELKESQAAEAENYNLTNQVRRLSNENKKLQGLRAFIHYKNSLNQLIEIDTDTINQIGKFIDKTIDDNPNFRYNHDWINFLYSEVGDFIKKNNLKVFDDRYLKTSDLIEYIINAKIEDNNIRINL